MTRSIGIDILRFLAVLLVISRHTFLPDDLPRVIKMLARGGWVGVDIFFVLSGFLVASLLFREYKRTGFVDIKLFLIRRGFKIYPPFYLMIGITIIVRKCMGEWTDKQRFFGEVLFLQNYLGGIWGHTWSLAVEEHFYILLAMAVYLMILYFPAKPLKRIPCLFVVIALFCFTLRVYNMLMIPNFEFRTHFFGTHVRIDSLMYGVLLSYLYNFHNLEKRTSKIPLIVLVIFAVLFLSPAFLFELEKTKWISTIGVIVFYIGGGLLLIIALRFNETKSLPVRFFADLGASSYSIYLWHIPFIVWSKMVLLSLFIHLNEYVILLTSFFGAFAFGWLASRLVEKPALLLRDRFFPPHYRALSTEY